MQAQTQFSIFLINRPGVMASVTTALAEAGVNLDALMLADSGEHGVLRVVSAGSADTIREVLTETHDRWTETDVLVLDMSNTPGGFAAIAQKLADAGVNVLYAYATAGADVKKNIAVFKVADTDAALRTLAE
jgi:hypothetical protein